MYRNRLFFLLLFFVSSIAFSQSDEYKIVPPEVLFKEITQRNFTISPNGKYFTEVLDDIDETYLMIVDIDDYKLKHKIPMGKTGIDNFYWLTNNRLLFQSEGAMYVMDIDGRNALRIASRRSYNKVYHYRNWYKNMRYNSLIGLMPEKKSHVLIETHDHNAYASIKEVNIFTGSDYYLIHGENYKINKWITDANGKIRLGMKFNKEGTLYYKFNEAEKKIEPFDVKIDGRRHKLDISANSYISQSITFEGFGYDPNIIYLTSNIGSDKRKLISYNILEEKVEDVVLEDVNCDVNDIDGEGVSFVLDFSEQEIAGIRYTGIVPQYKWLSNKFKGIHDELNRQYPSYFNEIIDSDVEGARFLVHQWSDSKLGNIGVFDTKDNSYAVMFHFNQDLNEYQLSKSKNIIVTTRDNYKLSGYLNFPPNYVEGDELPLVVIPHGGPWARDYWGFEYFSQYFATRGYATLRINFRGSTGFGKSHVLAGISSLDKIMINDIADATSYVVDNYAINSKKVTMFGYSYGGYATYMSLLKYPDLFNSGVAVAAPTDFSELLKYIKKSRSKFASDFLIYALGTQKNRYLDEISPISFTESINKPLLIFHGRQDRTVPVAQAENMAEMLKKDDKSVKIEIFNSEGHSISDPNILGYLLDESDQFFKKSQIED